MKTKLFSIQKFCTHDGPGIRTTVFFAGCPLSCKWCHNPEGKTGKTQILFDEKKCIGCGRCLSTGCGAQLFDPIRELDREKCVRCGKCVDLCPASALERSFFEADTEEILEKVLRDKAFYGETGGLTVSGGEPMNQPEAALALLQAAKNAGLPTALETSGIFPEKWVKELVGCVDLFLWDYKDSDPERYAANTGGSLSLTVNNLRLASSLGAKIVLRCILIHGVNNTASHAEAIRTLAEQINPEKVELIRYHPMGQSKYARLGIEDRFDSEEKIPTEQDLALFRETLSAWL